MTNQFDNIQRYKEFDSSGRAYILQDSDGEYVKYDDVEKIIKELIREHEIQLDKEYSKGYDKGLDAAYESGCFRKD